MNSLSLKQLFPLVVSQVPDMWEGEIRYEAFRQPIGSIVALLDKNGGEAIPHDPLGIAYELFSFHQNWRRVGII